MRGRVVLALIVVALLAVITVGYYVKVSSGPSSETSIIFYTSTQPKVQGLVQCTVSRHIVYQVEYTTSSTVATSNATEISDLLTYLTSTTATMPVGASTAFTTSFTTSFSTYTGVLAVDNVTNCQYLSG
jgi:hypothetical protein